MDRKLQDWQPSANLLLNKLQQRATQARNTFPHHTTVTLGIAFVNAVQPLIVQLNARGWPFDDNNFNRD